MIEETEKVYIAKKYGNGVLTYEAANAFAINCLIYEEETSICRGEIFDWCYTNLGWTTPSKEKKTVLFKSVPLGATVTVK